MHQVSGESCRYIMILFRALKNYLKCMIYCTANYYLYNSNEFLANMKADFKSAIKKKNCTSAT